MKTNIPILLGLVMAAASQAQDNSTPPTPQQVSYACGLSLGQQIQQMGADVDVNTIVQAIQDVQQGKPAKMQPAELPAIFKQEENFARAKMAARDQAEGAVFLAKNAATPGVTVLPDGLQYRVLQAGAGPSPKISDAVGVKYRGTLIDGTEFDHGDDFHGSLAAQMRGWQEALPMMKVGAKWQIFLPPNLAYGRNWRRKVGPESAVIFEIELMSIETPAVDSNQPHAIPQ